MEKEKGFLGKLFSSLFGWRRRPRQYRRLVTWIESTSGARFDGSQPAGEVEQHLRAKLSELESAGMPEKHIRGFRRFVESSAYEQLIEE